MHMSLPIMCLSFQWIQMSLHSLCLLSTRSLVLWILPCIPQCFHLLHARSCRSIWKILWTSLQVSMLHPRHHSSWTSNLLPFLLGYFFIAGRLCINDFTQQCHITRVSLRPLSFFWKYRHIILHLGFFLELSSLVLRNKSHPSFLVGDCTWSFLQVKYKSNTPVALLETFHNDKFLYINI